MFWNDLPTLEIPTTLDSNTSTQSLYLDSPTAICSFLFVYFFHHVNNIWVHIYRSEAKLPGIRDKKQERTKQFMFQHVLFCLSSLWNSCLLVLKNYAWQLIDYRKLPGLFIGLQLFNFILCFEWIQPSFLGRECNFG